MLNPLIAHFVELPLRPTPAQAQALLRLSAAHRSAELLALDQASLAISGHDVALSALAGGRDHPDRSPAGEASALAATPLFQDCPPAVLEDAIDSYRSRLRQRTVHTCGDLPQVSASRVIAGPGLVRPSELGVLDISGVGQVRADLTHMPDWAHDALWCGEAPDDSTPPGHEQIVYSGSAYVKHEWTGGRWNWTVELDFAEIW